MNAELLLAYERDGVVKAPSLFGQDDLRALRDGIERYIEFVAPGLPANDIVWEADGESVRNLWRMEQHDPFFLEIAAHPDILDLARACVKGDPVLMGVETFNKPARVGSAVPPHQDNAYFCLAPADAVTVWIAIDAVTAANGPVSYIPGSHLEGPRRHVPSGVAGNSMGIEETPMCDAPYTDLLTPGDALLHHASTIHYSAPNESDAPRCGFLMVFKGAHCVVSEDLRAAYLEGKT